MTRLYFMKDSLYFYKIIKLQSAVVAELVAWRIQTMKYNDSKDL